LNNWREYLIREGYKTGYGRLSHNQVKERILKWY